MQPDSERVVRGLRSGRRLIHVHVPVGAWIVGVVAGMLIATAVGPRSAAAQPGTGSCLGFPPFEALTEEPALALRAPAIQRTTLTEAGRQHDAPSLAWDLPADAREVKCFWVAMKQPGEKEFPAVGSFILTADTRAFIPDVEGAPGEWCFRIVPLGDKVRGPATELCTELLNPKSPFASGGEAPAPPVAGTGRTGTSVNWWLGLAGVALGASLLTAIPGFITRRVRSRK